MRIILSIVSLTFLISCSNSEIQELKEQQLKLNSIETIFNELELDYFEKACSGFDENMDLIHLFCADSISLKFVNSVNRYKIIKKSKDSFILNYKLLAKNLLLEKQQLKYLKLDLDNNLIPSDSIFFFLEKEKENLQSISDETNNVVSLYNEIVIVHDSLYLTIKELAKNNCY